MPGVWKRDALLILLCFGGLGAAAAGLLFGHSAPSVQRPTGESYQPPSFRATIATLNREFQEHLDDRGLAQAGQADSLLVARRLSLALTGTVPSVEELRQLEQIPETRRVAWWTEHLLSDRRCADYIAERFARAYVGTEDGPFLVYRRRRFVSWLSDAIAENRRYDELVRELVAAQGTWTDSPAVNFTTVTSDPQAENKPDEIRLAGRVCRAFLGVRIDCLQCHDDFLGTVELGSPTEPEPGQQRHFHELAAFFSETRASLLGIQDRPHPYRYQYLYEPEESVVEPQPPFLRTLIPSDGTRRQRLAKWITHPENQPFARATVNRVWALMFGRPLTESVDSIPLHGELPPGLETLATDFAANGFDLHRLIRLIAASEVFQRDSRADFQITPEHEEQGAVFPLTRLRPEQVAGSLLQASALKTIDAQTHLLFRLARYAQENEFVTRYGDTGEDEFDDHGGTVTQRLLMMNGKLVKERTGINPLMNASSQIARLSPDPGTAVETAYLAVLTRRPTAAEADHFRQSLVETEQDDWSAALEDLYWVLINSTEFAWNH